MRLGGGREGGGGGGEGEGEDVGRVLLRRCCLRRLPSPPVLLLMLPMRRMIRKGEIFMDQIEESLCFDGWIGD